MSRNLLREAVNGARDVVIPLVMVSAMIMSALMTAFILSGLYVR